MIVWYHRVLMVMMRLESHHETAQLLSSRKTLKSYRYDALLEVVEF